MYVAPGCWGKGVSRSLCERAEQHLRLDGFIEVTLWVLKDNDRAVKFYQSNGFVLDLGLRKRLTAAVNPCRSSVQKAAYRRQRKQTLLTCRAASSDVFCPHWSAPAVSRAIRKSECRIFRAACSTVRQRAVASPSIQPSAWLALAQARLERQPRSPRDGKWGRSLPAHPLPEKLHRRRLS